MKEKGHALGAAAAAATGPRSLSTDTGTTRTGAKHGAITHAMEQAISDDGPDRREHENSTENYGTARTHAQKSNHNQTHT
ncbi:uncharacterized protein UV8b_05966 [Ustilaginoidea virens]|uniref:Uncharacterized protein n=1 Tax=Ustilaginoidea virens TaxID=1159556 RepID=A0A8E5MIM8_USTVR|nr:uncharacterized protein UV8b_05966 [Ustilaginoidea virens]QUC21723.1 hypothetical protein UV8b_05966 [Ustilaginoidea virens]